MIAGTTTVKMNSIYRVNIIFTDGEFGIVEVDEKIYKKLLDIICQSYWSFGNKCSNKSKSRRLVDMEIIKTASTEQEAQCCGPMSLIS